MLPDLPLDLFEIDVEAKSNPLKKVSKVIPPFTKSSQITLHLNKQTSLNIAVVRLYKKLNIDFNYCISILVIY